MRCTGVTSAARVALPHPLFVGDQRQTSDGARIPRPGRRLSRRAPNQTPRCGVWSCTDKSTVFSIVLEHPCLGLAAKTRRKKKICHSSKKTRGGRGKKSAKARRRRLERARGVCPRQAPFLSSSSGGRGGEWRLKGAARRARGAFAPAPRRRNKNFSLVLFLGGGGGRGAKRGGGARLPIARLSCPRLSVCILRVACCGGGGGLVELASRALQYLLNVGGGGNVLSRRRGERHEGAKAKEARGIEKKNAAAALVCVCVCFWDIYIIPSPPRRSARSSPSFSGLYDVARRQ